MAKFKVQYELTNTGGSKSGVVSSTVNAANAQDARNKIMAQHPNSKVRIVSCVKMGD